MISQTTTTSSQQDEATKMYLGAKVRWPPECPDDILEDAIKEARFAQKEYNEEGKLVNSDSLKLSS